MSQRQQQHPHPPPLMRQGTSSCSSQYKASPAVAGAGPGSHLHRSAMTNANAAAQSQAYTTTSAAQSLTQSQSQSSWDRQKQTKGRQGKASRENGDQRRRRIFFTFSSFSPLALQAPHSASPSHSINLFRSLILLNLLPLHPWPFSSSSCFSHLFVLLSLVSRLSPSDRELMLTVAVRVYV